MLRRSMHFLELRSMIHQTSNLISQFILFIPISALYIWSLFYNNQPIQARAFIIIKFAIMMSQRKQQKPVNDKAIIPMTIYQIRNQLKEDTNFQGQNFHTVSIVGRLESFRREARSNMLMFNDGTGNIEGQINIGEGKMPPYAEGIPLQGKQGEYFFVVLKPKFNQDNKKYYIHMIKEVTNFNQITKHQSDIVLSHLIRKNH